MNISEIKNNLFEIKNNFKLQLINLILILLFLDKIERFFLISLYITFKEPNNEKTNKKRIKKNSNSKN